MISLEKTHSARIDLTKHEAFGKVKINLNWGGKKAGLLGGLFGGAKKVDLDLGCLYELADGRKGAVQALGNNFGSLDREPFIQLAGDDRTGENNDGEWLGINGAQWAQVKRVLVYAFIYEGVPSWESTNGVMTVYPPKGDPIRIELAGDGQKHSFCVGALLENEGGQMKVTRVDRYFEGHAKADQAFGWGMHWVSGSKD